MSRNEILLSPILETSNALLLKLALQAFD